jgi:DNA-binding transcriptional LysR family regulator
VAIRGGPQRDSSLIARILRRGEVVVCASPEYLAGHGRPSAIADPANHDLVTIAHPVSEQLLGFDTEWLQRQSWLIVDEWGVLRRALIDGLGIGILPQFALLDDFDKGRLERILPELGLPDALQAVYPSRHHLSRKVRVFVDYLADKLAH